MTGSKYLVECERRARAGGCRAVPGAERAARAELAGSAAEGHRHRRDRADARAPRSLRLPAAPGVAGIPRTRVLHGGDAGSLSHRAARCRTAAGRGRGTSRTGTASRKHAPALPLYTEIDAFRAVSQLQPCGYDRTLPVAQGIDIEFINAGHLLGSSYVRMRLDGKTILFGGDLGRFGRPVLPDPTMVTAGRLSARRIDLRRSRARA